MTSGAASGSQPDRTEREVDIVVCNNKLVVRYLVKIHQSRYSLSGEIHKSLRFGDDEMLILVIGFSNQGFGLQAGELDLQPGCQPVNQHIPDIMPVLPVLPARIA